LYNLIIMPCVLYSTRQLIANHWQHTFGSIQH
jgi:hypothetical protein